MSGLFQICVFILQTICRRMDDNKEAEGGFEEQTLTVHLKVEGKYSVKTV